MVSPLVPATLITPIAPHSLSFRPILTSASSEITVRIPDTARADGTSLSNLLLIHCLMIVLCLNRSNKHTHSIANAV
jgi:NAD kinase